MILLQPIYNLVHWVLDACTKVKNQLVVILLNILFLKSRECIIQVNLFIEPPLGSREQ